ncbi:Protein turtle [Nymphon striatum]|nr:Protein turtle [Nymphon striatum]
MSLTNIFLTAYIRNEEKRTVTADQGDNVILPCIVDFPDGEPVAYVVQWKKHGQAIPIYIWYQGYPPHFGEGYRNRISLVDEASLNLTAVTEDDQGWYECKIVYLNRRPPTAENGTWVYLEVRAPPHFEIKPPEIEYVELGKGVFIPCKAAGTPSPAVEWYKDKKKLRSGSRIQTTVRGLRISKIRETDIGNYICAASNREGRAEAHFVVLTAGGAVITVPPQNKTVIEPNKIEIICDAKAIPSNVTHRWYKDGKDITRLQWQVSRSKIREHDGGLVIEPSAADDSGKYTCEVTNGIGAPRTAHAYINVEYPAKVTHHPKVQYLPAGLPGKLKCHFKANPPVRLVTWKKDGVTVNFSEIISQKKDKGTLYFKKVLREHAGKYTCTPCNIRGCAGDSEAMEVFVRDPPVFTIKPEPTYQRGVNGEVKLVCKGDGSPRPKVFWRRADGNPIPTIRTRKIGGNLTIKGLKKEDYGLYECVVENDVATLLTSTMLIVEDTSPHAPKNLTVIPDTFSARVSWLPAYDGGHQQSYTVWYSKEGSDKWKQIKIPGQRTEIELHPLQQYTKYFFKVQSANKRAGRLPGPRNLTAKIHKSGGIIFSWLPPENPSVPTAYYNFEISRKKTGSYNVLEKKIPPVNTSYLMRDMEVGRYFYFKVVAHYENGIFSGSVPFKYEISAPKSTEKHRAITAGVIGGILFFIVAIVLSVCGIKICNKRRRRKAEKGGLIDFVYIVIISVNYSYMMVTCPVTETRNGGQSQAPSPVPLKKFLELLSNLNNFDLNYFLNSVDSGGKEFC